MKIVLNKDYGVFGLSNEACRKLNCERYSYQDYNLRTSPELVRVVEELGRDASATFANLEIIEIPDNITDYRIETYDGKDIVYYVIDGKIVKI